MPRLRLTDDVVGSMRGGRRTTVVWDTEVWGFGCRLPPEGPPEYFAYYRTRAMGLRRRVAIGHHGALDCEQARMIARDVIGRNAPQQFGRAVRKTAGGG